MDAYRHGDVIIIKCDSIPKDAKKLKHNHLAEGEVTGHYHAIEGRAELFELDGKMYVGVREYSKLTHQEHSTIDIPVGVYEVTIQREYEPNGWRNVQD